MLLRGLASTKFPLRSICFQKLKFQTAKNMVPMSGEKCSAPRLSPGMLAASSIKAEHWACYPYRHWACYPYRHLKN